MALELTDANFKDKVLDSDKVVMVDFWAEWCGPCRMIAPIVEEIANEREDVVVGKLDVDSNKVSYDYGIRSIPTILFFKNGKVIDKQVGVTSKSVLNQKLDTLVKVEA